MGAVNVTAPSSVSATKEPSAASLILRAPPTRTRMRSTRAPGFTVKSFSTLLPRAASDTSILLG